MPMQNHAETVERLQRALGKGVSQSPWLINLPGRSIACKIDQYYYLAIMPAFVEQLARLGGMFPDQVESALIFSGNFITKAPERTPTIPLTVSWGGPTMKLKAAFVEAEFIDRGIKTYSDLGMVPSVSELKISSADKESVEAFFEGKTPPQRLAYF